MILKGENAYVIFKKDDFSICSIRLSEQVALPNGKVTNRITAKGYLIPTDKINLLLTGDFELYKGEYTFNVTDVEEFLPDTATEIKNYLCLLKGVGKVLAERLYDAFGNNVLDVIAKDSEALTKVNGISSKKAEKIFASYSVRQGAHKLFMLVHRYGVSANQCAKIFKLLGADAHKIVENNPYVMVGIAGVGFSTADYVARSLSQDFKNSPERIKAGIIEVLLEGEHGSGRLFSGYTPLPTCVKEGFLRPELRELLDKEETYTTGSTYLPRNVLYVLLLLLLDTQVSEKEFDQYCIELHTEQKVYVAVDKKKKESDNEKIKIYRMKTAKSEFSAAKAVRQMLEEPIEDLPNLLETISEEEEKLGILLSDEQQNAVKMALSNHISIITGGPGTGKTSVQKTIINVFKRYFPYSGVLLTAPTGRAAKRMSEASGSPALTLHKALGLYGDDVPLYDENNIHEQLIIVDETSMIGANLFASLMRNVGPGKRLVLIGDIDQLPSVEVGAVLRELIDSKKVPTTKLTKTYRQSSGSSIVTNAARIRVGERGLEQNQDFNLVIMDTSDHIQEMVCSKVPGLIKEYGEDEVLVLTSYRKNTSTGANALNEALRNVLRKDITETTPYFQKGNIKIYEGDRVMNIKNTYELTNGDIGKVIKIQKHEDELLVTCQFDGREVVLEDEDTQNLDLAYATTVHKSQGSEAKCVVLVCDMAHKIMLKRNLFYTGVTRAKQKIYIIAQPQAIPLSIDTQDSVHRRSQLGKLI